MSDSETFVAPYQIPRPCFEIPIHSEIQPQSSFTTESFFNEYGYGLVGDLLLRGINKPEIEAAVISDSVNVAYWPAPPRESVTDLLWAKDSKIESELENLANLAVQHCMNSDPSVLTMGTYISVGERIGSQSKAIVGLTYARHQGKLREILVPRDREFFKNGPMYVVRGTPSEKHYVNLLHKIQSYCVEE